LPAALWGWVVSRFARKIDANQPEIVEALEGAGCQVESLAPLGRGAPDLLVQRGKNLYLLEVKSKDGDLTPAQRKWHAFWRVTVVRDCEAALRAVGL